MGEMLAGVAGSDPANEIRMLRRSRACSARCSAIQYLAPAAHLLHGIHLWRIVVVLLFSYHDYALPCI